MLAALVLVLRAAYPRLLERRQERRLPVGPDGVIVGAAAIDLRRTNSPGVLLLHGGGDTPQVMRELAQRLHDRGFSVRAPLLANHGRALKFLAAFSAEEWRDQVRREFESMRAGHEWVGVVGLSVGGALALTLAATRDDVRALVVLAPYVAIPARVRILAATSRWWGPLLPYVSSRGSKSIRDRVAASGGLSHGLMTPAGLRALAEVANHGDASLPRVKAPTLVIQSREDNRISVAAAERAYARLGATDKRFVWTEGAGHVITADFGKERVFELTADWLQAHCRP